MKFKSLLESEPYTLRRVAVIKNFKNIIFNPIWFYQYFDPEINDWKDEVDIYYHDGLKRKVKNGFVTIKERKVPFKKLLWIEYNPKMTDLEDVDIPDSGPACGYWTDDEYYENARRKQAEWLKSMGIEP